MQLSLVRLTDAREGLIDVFHNYAEVTSGNLTAEVHQSV
jgi:hypothetical protein